MDSLALALDGHPRGARGDRVPRVGEPRERALIDKNDAVLHQSKADDEWARYQAMGVKVVLYATQAAGVTNPELAKKWSGEAERERSEQKRESARRPRARRPRASA